MPRKKYAMTLVGATAAAVLALTAARPQARTARAAAAAPPADDAISFRVVFGYRRIAAKRYDGSISVTGGTLRSLESWRFMQTDAIQPPNSWKLEIHRLVFENQPDNPTSVAAGGPGTQARNLVPAGLFVTVDRGASSVSFQTAQGNFSVAIRDLAWGNLLWYLGGDVQVERVPATQRISPQNAEQHDYPSITVARSGDVWLAWQAYEDRGDHVYVQRRGGAPTRLNDEKADIFGTSIAEDPDGRIHVAWSERHGTDWNLYERIFDGRNWSPRAQITHGNVPNAFHKFAAGPRALNLVWVGFENGDSYLYAASYTRSGGWSQPQRVGGPSVWAPDAACDRDGNMHVAWDSYSNGNYDIYYRRIASDGTPAGVEQITKSPEFDAHPSLAIDGKGRPWLAWDLSGANWGKDWNHEDQNRSTVLYKDRSIKVVVKDAGVWKEAPDFSTAVPERLARYWELPHLASDGTGRIWALFQIRTSVSVNRIDYWASGALWDLYLTTLDHGAWQPAAFLSHSSGRNEAPFQIAGGGSSAPGVWMTWATDGRTLKVANTGNYQAPTVVHYDIYAASAAAPPASGMPVLTAYTEPMVRAQVMHPNEREDVRRIRGYRTTADGAELRILRGDFHRHSDISNDGAGDGSLQDFYRYMMDAASMDTGIITDHNDGGDVEYNWWRIEKSEDLFHIPGGYTPLFGYERSVNYPNGHRNVVFDHRGVKTLPVLPGEMRGTINSGPLVYPYLRQNRGIAMEHSLATGQGTDWRDNDPDLEPLVEIYQGYHAAYEYEGGPRAESENNHLLIHGAYEPKGFFWNALEKGYKLGMQASSDHISTHCSYTLIWSPSTDRAAIVDSMRHRHAYGATDNIVLDFQAVDGNATHMMGDIITAPRGLRLHVKVLGTDTITHVDLIRNSAIVYTLSNPGKKDVDFSFVDSAPVSGANWYYARVTQIDRNLAWSSPIWVTYR